MTAVCTRLYRDSEREAVSFRSVSANAFLVESLISKGLAHMSLCSKVGQKLQGWVRTLRRHQDIAFAQISNGNCHVDVQAVFTPELAKGIHTGSSVVLEGTVIPSIGPRQLNEFRVEKIIHLGKCPPMEYPIAKKFHTPEHLRGIPHMRLRSRKMQQVIRFRNDLLMKMHQFFQEADFMHISTPVLTQNDCEGGAEAFGVDFFGKKSFLTVSGQLHLEAAASAFERVYTIGPCFRAEAHHTQRHLAEFWMVECELAFVDSLEVLMQWAQKCIKQVLLNCQVEGVAWLNHANWPVLAYEDAVRLCVEKQVAFTKTGVLDSVHERFLTEQHFNSPVFITDFPVESKPFYTKEAPNNKTTFSFDLIFPQVGEICGGSLRKDDYNLLRSNISTESDESLEWYLDLRKYGASPHGGFGIGFERLVQWATKTENIRDTIPFPRADGCFKC
jgi:asparaginyl-tRNA synthetase